MTAKCYTTFLSFNYATYPGVKSRWEGNIPCLCGQSSRDLVHLPWALAMMGPGQLVNMGLWALQSQPPMTFGMDWATGSRWPLSSADDMAFLIHPVPSTCIALDLLLLSRIHSKLYAGLLYFKQKCPTGKSMSVEFQNNKNYQLLSPLGQFLSFWGNENMDSYL